MSTKKLYKTRLWLGETPNIDGMKVSIEQWISELRDSEGDWKPVKESKPDLWIEIRVGSNTLEFYVDGDDFGAEKGNQTLDIIDNVATTLADASRRYREILKKHA